MQVKAALALLFAAVALANPVAEPEEQNTDAAQATQAAQGGQDSDWYGGDWGTESYRGYRPGWGWGGRGGWGGGWNNGWGCGGGWRGCYNVWAPLKTPYISLQTNTLRLKRCRWNDDWCYGVCLPRFADDAVSWS